jgi:hypothetical protein
MIPAWELALKPAAVSVPVGTRQRRPCILRVQPGGRIVLHLFWLVGQDEATHETWVPNTSVSGNKRAPNTQKEQLLALESLWSELMLGS